MSAHTIAVEALKRIPVRARGETNDAYAERLRQSIPVIPPLVRSKMGQSAAPPSRAQLLWHVAEKAAVLIGAAAFLHEAYPQAAPLQTDRAANGRSREAQNETQRIYMRNRRAAEKAAKLAKAAAQ